MNPTKLALLRAKMFVQRHRVAFAIGGTAATCLTLNRIALQQHDDFLKEKDLYDEFYNLDR